MKKITVIACLLALLTLLLTLPSLICSLARSR